MEAGANIPSSGGKDRMSIGIKIPLQQAPPESKRYTRDTFLYQDPMEPKDKFAQCGSCTLYVPGRKRCSILGTALKVEPTHSCNLYIHGDPHEQPIVERVTPEDAGFVTRKIRCEHCRAFDDKGHCGFYQMLNDLAPTKFDLDEAVDAYGCCTANKARS